MHFTEVKGILSAQNGMNIYRGCTHGCIYCDARSSCYQMNHMFEDIEVKSNAPELLEIALRKKRRKCMIGTGAMSDPYMHCEEQLQMTRTCLQIIERYGFGATVQTKSDRILRDLDLLKSINEKAKCVVQMTLTTFDEQLCKLVEPDVCTTKRRLEVLEIMRDNGIPTVVWLSPILPFINDTEENLRGILDYCVRAEVKGIVCFGMGTTMRDGDREYFYKKLDESFPGVRQKYINRYGGAYECPSDNSPALMRIFRSECAKNRIISYPDKVFAYLHEFPQEAPAEQLTLF